MAANWPFIQSCWRWLQRIEGVPRAKLEARSARRDARARHTANHLDVRSDVEFERTPEFWKLGVIARKYKINFFGGTTSSPVDRAGTDRFWVTWLLDSRHVAARLDNSPPAFDADLAPRAVKCAAGLTPCLSEYEAGFKSPQFMIEIPPWLEFHSGGHRIVYGLEDRHAHRIHARFGIGVPGERLSAI